MGDSTALAWLVLTPFLGLHAKSNLRTESVGSSGQASRLSVTAAGDKRGGFKVCTDHGFICRWRQLALSAHRLVQLIPMFLALNIR
ncbi:hypothetical protein BDV35DRAFT_163309 [Aspergillus flavus]|uniref:Secreted protein n=1 Tax=Aspergillus flavus TaxID=5059 RepID=A0A5N6H464_ASPFL|nr:hypothetical protein BDV35DRAFT_163309 [Aspergillus flavus]